MKLIYWFTDLFCFFTGGTDFLSLFLMHKHITMYLSTYVLLAVHFKSKNNRVKNIRIDHAAQNVARWNG